MGDRGDELVTGDIFRRVRFGSTLDAGGPKQMAADFVSIDGDDTVVVAAVDSPPLTVGVPLLLRPLLLHPFCCGCLVHSSSLVSASLVWPLEASEGLPTSQSVAERSGLCLTSSSSFLSILVRFNDGPAVPDGSASTFVTKVVASEDVVVDEPDACVTAA